MNNEKILTNAELLDITAGSSFLDKNVIKNLPINYHPVVICKYGKPPIFDDTYKQKSISTIK